jgi:shikimate kinase
VSIFLIGYRGSGKSSVGRILARRLGWPFVDADELLVQRAGMSIKQIFEQHGEPYFRDLESAILLELCSHATCAIALGGGAVLREQNRAMLKQSGHPIIYLHADAQTLFNRIQSDPITNHSRPHLTSHAGEIKEVESLLALRLPLYRETMTDEIDVTNLSAEQVADRIVQLLKPTSR